MILNYANCKETIESYKNQDWQPLFDLIPEIEKTSKYGAVAGDGINKHGVNQFFKIVYELPIIISFDWSSWDEGRKIAQDKNFDFDTIDIATKCKLITAIVRNDRFCEGTLVSAFDSGLILKILKSIKRNINSNVI